MLVTIPYKPRHAEAHRIMARARFTALVAHRRFGKTVLAVNHLIRCALTCDKRAGRFGYVAPFRVQAKAVAWDYLKHYTAAIPGRAVNEGELAIDLPSPGGGARVRVFGADNPDALRGLYFDGVVMDEVAQMKAEVWEETIQPALSDRKGFAVFIGTPKGVNLFSKIFYHASREQAAGNSQWAAMRYPIDQTSCLDPEEIERLRVELSPNTFRQEMLCDFSASSDDCLISLDECRAAFARVSDPGLVSQWPLVIGVDIARFGSDATVFFPRRGPCALAPVVLGQKSNTDVAHRLIALIEETAPALVNIDQGQGTGVIDIVSDVCSSSSTLITEVPFGGSALDASRYANRRAEMWHHMAEWVKTSGQLPAGPFEDMLCQDLSGPCYSFDSQGRFKLESKDEIKRRLSRSTDLGDALALTFAVPVSPLIKTRPGQRRIRKEYDPFA